MSDRHGRLHRSETDPLRRPADGFRASSARRFAGLVREAISGLQPRIREALAAAEITITDVPPTEPEPGRSPGDEPLLAHFDPAPARLLVVRRPLEARAASRAELVSIIRAVIGQEVAYRLGFDDP